jgi:hypothetical protein
MMSLEYFFPELIFLNQAKNLEMSGSKNAFIITVWAPELP